MFSSVEQTRALTGYTVSLDLVNQAQAVLEVFLGKTEAEIDSADDLAILGRATAFQAAYMLNNADRVYEQVAVRSIAQSDGGAVLNLEMWAPFIAPMAVFALKSLSWKKSRSVKTGPVFERVTTLGWEYV
jgi:hypothetical protein